ncbi:MAG: MTAP family purine nucleoside phosphorylase [Phycisphaerales bacterium]
MAERIEDLHLAIIGGTGLEARLTDAGLLSDVEVVTPATPFGPPSAPIRVGVAKSGDRDGAGSVREAAGGGDGERVGDGGRPVKVALLARHGEAHRIPPSKVPYRANIFALKALGVTHVIASGATGSLRESIAPGELVVPDQLIDRTEGRARSFFERAAVHVEFAEPFCPVTRKWLLAAARDAGVTAHDGGCYVCMEGPSFSTKAESHLHRAWGGDLIGMTALPEARLAREAELAYALLALPTDYDCWRPPPPGAAADRPAASLIEEIIGNLERATDASMRVLERALSDCAALRAEPSPAHEALKLAIWTPKDQIDPDEISRLAPIWGRHFS